MSEERDPVGFGSFSGLRLDLPADQIGGEGAIDLLDVDWEQGFGLLRPREGVAKLGTTEAPEVFARLFAHSDATLVASVPGGKLAAVNSEGKIDKTVEGLTLAVSSFARFGTPSARYTYIGGKNQSIRRFDGTNFAAPTATVNGEAGKAMPIGRFLAAWPEGGNRLVAAGTDASGGPGGATSDGSFVWFSDPGNAEAWHTVAPEANYVQLTPGDGEEIVGCCVWNGQVFVFKESRVFIFYGVNLDSEGAPAFDFRIVNLGTTLRYPGSTTSPNIVAGTDAVYFVTPDGLWATNGQTPVLLSGDLAPLSGRRALPAPAVSTLGLARWQHIEGIVYHGRRLYMFSSAEGPGATRLLFVYDLDHRAWLVWTHMARAGCVWRREGTGREDLYISALASKFVYFYSQAATTDPLATINPYWQSGFYDLKSEDEKTFVEAKIWGEGVVTFASFKDFAAAPGFSTSVTIANGQGRERSAQSGSLFSHRLALSSGARVQRVVRYLRETRVATTKTGTQ